MWGFFVPEENSKGVLLAYATKRADRELLAPFN
jgi:hypothetical protein